MPEESLQSSVTLEVNENQETANQNYLEEDELRSSRRDTTISLAYKMNASMTTMKQCLSLSRFKKKDPQLINNQQALQRRDISMA